MKKTLLLCIEILMMLSMNQAQAEMSIMPTPTNKIDVQKSKVYFGWDEMNDVDAKTFIIFDDSSYAKDKNYVYLNGVIFPEIAPDEVHYIGYGKLKDKKNVYIGATIILDADPNTYQVLTVKDSDAYGKDKNSVYFWGEIIEGSEDSSFEVLSDNMGKDRNHVYYHSKIITEVDPATF